jgi:hypothetical protein
MTKDKFPGHFQRSENMRVNLEKLYSETQAFYTQKFKGVDLDRKMLDLYRGVGVTGVETYKPWSVESWSPLPSTAKRFGKMMGGNKGYTILRAQAPYSSVLFSHEAQKAYWTEEKSLKGKREFVVLGGGLRNLTAEEF